MKTFLGRQKPPFCDRGAFCLRFAAAVSRGAPTLLKMKNGAVTVVKLTPKQQAFVDIYIETGNATEAATKAGYSRKTAKQTGYENLKKPYLVDYIKHRNKEIESKRIANMKEVKEFWTQLLRDAEADPRDRLKASEYIAKTNGAFLERVEHQGQVTQRYDITQRIIEDPETRELARSLFRRAANPNLGGRREE